MTSVPLAPALLAPLLASSIPHRLRDRDAQCLYLRALFVVAAQPGAAAMRDGLLGAVVDHLLSLDVEIKWQDIAERPGRLRFCVRVRCFGGVVLHVRARVSVGLRAIFVGRV